MKIYKINSKLFSLIFFLVFLGFNSVLLLGINFGMFGFTRRLSIPIRIIIVACCILIFLLNYKKRVDYLKYFLFFSFLYFIRIFIDLMYNEFFYISYQELVFYFLSFSFIPFISLSKFDFSFINFKSLYNIFLISALLFSLLSIFFYGRFIGVVTRLSTSQVGENVINPLILSYSSALIIGVLLTYLLYNKTNSRVKYFSIAAIVLSLIPFFLGSSRGAIFAIFVPFIITAFTNFKFKKIFKYIFLFFILVFVLVYLDGYLGSGLFDRLLFTAEAIETGSSSANRISIWRGSFLQFTRNVFFGDKLNTDINNHYPHNIILEVLQTTGILGFIPFIVLVIKGFNASINIFKYFKQYSWIAVFFVQAFIQNMFSGALYSASWFWASLSIVLSLDYYLKYNSLNNNKLMKNI